MKNLFKLLVCGSRDFTDEYFVGVQIEYLISNKKINNVVIMHGDCPTGADHFADNWAIRNKVKRWRYPANWKVHGKKAGPIRNSRMLGDKPDACVAFFKKGAKNKGTNDMLTKCESKGIPVRKYYI